MFSIKTDIFPAKRSSVVEKLSDYPCFGKVFDRRNVKYFCMYMTPKHRFYYQKRLLTDKVIKGIHNFGKEAKTCNFFMPDVIDVRKILTRFKKLPVETNRVNTDIRTGFKIENDYLVKAYFTFGLREVLPDEAHVIQTLNVPLVFYLRPRNLKHKEKLEKEPVSKGRFPVGTMNYYDRRILEANTCYRIPPETIYMIVSTQKNFFRVDVVNKNYRIPFYHLDPVAVRVTKIKGIYDEPVKTPFIDEEKQEELMETYVEPSSSNCDESSVAAASSSSTTYKTPDNYDPKELNDLISFLQSPPTKESESMPVVQSPPPPSTPPPPPPSEEATTTATFYIFPNPPILDRTVCVTSTDFVKAYQCMVNKEYLHPNENLLTDTEVFPVSEPLNLTSSMEEQIEQVSCKE